ncbi:DNA uptake protein [Anaeromyxobacter dehalogenans 2CP-1]|uniref:DNA uptake protein n=1 Tax=Anaeromyxobacter dehalogenans (strain ATCC BAA-258 / DSM 21875 / 2CP-1) TaxID=455488 RepID=B8J951_ANAD2|nr:helix-hairpin-helix domain-containing protein [Anaeromyxobacter dehalogenans]ACL65457.1 DNA uptake protein [Anaeromyxobacter dehalogenans 2CP-1]
MPRRVALALVLAATLLPARFRVQVESPPPPPACAPEGRGVPPRHWLGCAADPGGRRALAADERLVLALPIDPNTAGARELAHVPGLSRRLAEAVVRSREQDGRFRSAEDLRRVRGIGPRRLEQARAALQFEAAAP